VEAIPGRFERLGLPPPRLRCGDGASGWAEEAPFDRILVSAACPTVPQPLLEQIASGGLLAAPVGDRATQRLTLVRRTAVGYDTLRTTYCVFVPLLGPWGFGD
jgi:protein-L-isoaspartate(D-aspartate) O-methyltransferase